MAKVSSKKGKDNKGTELKGFLGVLYTLGIALFYIGVIVLGWYLAMMMANDKLKNWILVTFSHLISDFAKWQNAIVNDNVRMLLVLLFVVCCILGPVKFAQLFYRWFRTKESFEFPYVTKAFNLAPLKNRFYDEHYKGTLSDVRDLKGQVRRLEKDQEQLRVRAEKAESELERVTQERLTLAGQAEAYVKQSETSFKAVSELHRLMGHLLALEKAESFSEYEKEFDILLTELSNTIIKVTTGSGSAKSSAVLRVDSGCGVLRIVGRNGLRWESRKKEFQPGQGFAGWIWANGQHDYCPDVTQDRRFDHEPSRPYRSIIGMPVRSLDQSVVGVLLVQSTQLAAFDVATDTALLTYFAKFLAVCFADHEKRLAMQHQMVAATVNGRRSESNDSSHEVVHND